MSDAIRLNSITLNCPDAPALASFYAEITDGEVTFSQPGWATVATPEGRIGFQTVERYKPPLWPGEQGTPLLHIDFLVDDLEATEQRVLRAGAVRFDFQPNDDHCLVFADPAGNPFCLSTWELG